MNEKIKEQILAIRNSGVTNMFDLLKVPRIAMELGYDELVEFLLDHKAEYSRFILTGKVDKSR